MSEIVVKEGLRTSFRENKVPAKPTEGRNTMRLVVKELGHCSDTGVNAPYLYDIAVEFGTVGKGQRLSASDVKTSHSAHMTSEVINAQTTGLRAHQVVELFSRFEAGQVAQPRVYGKLAA